MLSASSVRVTWENSNAERTIPLTFSVHEYLILLCFAFSHFIDNAFFIMWSFVATLRWANLLALLFQHHWSLHVSASHFSNSISNYSNYICYDDKWCYYYNYFGAPWTMPIEVSELDWYMVYVLWLLHCLATSPFLPFSLSPPSPYSLFPEAKINK